MKMQLKLMLLLFGVSFTTLMGCKKKDNVITPVAATITISHKAVVMPGTLSGIFTATGGISTSGTELMIVQPNGTDSIHCTQTITASEGSITMLQDCSKSKMSGSWHITSSTGKYAALQGNGTLTMMMFPPGDPSGNLGIDTLTGMVTF